MAGLTQEQFMQLMGNKQEPVTSSIASVLNLIKKPLDYYALNKNIPLVGGQSIADLTGLTGTQSLVQDFSQGKPMMQEGLPDPRFMDVAGMLPMVKPAAIGAGQAAKYIGKEALRQGYEGTGLLGKLAPDVKSYILKNPELDKAAKEYFGTTFYPQETGYLMNDLSRLDLSGRSQATGYKNIAGRYIPETGQPDYLKMQRGVDHREVAPLMPDTSGGWEGMSNFMDQTGAIRYDADTGISLVDTNKPTKQQIEKIVNDFKRSNTPMIIDIDKKLTGSNFASKEFENPTPEQVTRWINRQYGLLKEKTK